MSKESLSVLVPVYNEKLFVRESLKRLEILITSQYLEFVQIIVVNDGSTDGTAAILSELETEKIKFKNEKCKWLFLKHEKNQGKGKAIQTALKESKGTLTVIHDADLEYHPKDLLKMIPLFFNEKVDAVYGSRFLFSEYRKIFMFKHQLGNIFLTFLSNVISDLNLSDMETCYKMIRTDLFKSIPIESNDFRIEPEITIKLAKRKAVIFEVPISYSGRTYEEGKKINWKDGVRALMALVKFKFSDNIQKCPIK
jgi:glycosyltransferase involved in cell wall biosynthesis